METQDIISSLKKIHATIEVLETKVQVAHWNEEGEGFLYFHPILGTIYEELEDFEDKIAERIRQLGGYTFISLSEIIQSSIIREKTELEGIKSCIKYLNNDFKVFELILKDFSQQLNDDLVSQQLLLDLQMYLGKRRYLFSSELKETKKED